MSFALLALLWFVPPALAEPPPIPRWRQLGEHAKVAAESNRPDEAVRLYRSALAVKPDWEEGWWSLGTLYYERDLYRECRESFRRFTSINKKSGPAYVMLGLCEFHLEEYSAAFRSIRRGEELGLPENSQLTRVAYYHEALLVTKLENYERALFLLSLLIKDGAENPSAVAAIGIAALRRPVFPRELPEAERPLALRAGRAVALGFQRRPAEARREFESLVADHPTVPNLHYTFGTFLQGQEADAAIEAWKSELEVSPGHLPSLVSLAFEYLTRGDAASARPYAERAMKTAPDHFMSRAAIGRVLLDSGDHNSAIKHLEIAAKLSPDSPQIRLALGTAYSRAGRQAEAARERDAFAALKKKSSQ
jgi:tetratricopeptide (TPR) repeat protein